MTRLLTLIIFISLIALTSVSAGEIPSFLADAEGEVGVILKINDTDDDTPELVSLQKSNLPLSVKHPRMMAHFKNKVNKQQKSIISEIDNHPEYVSSYKAFWITDAIYVKGDAAYIRQLAVRDDVEFVFENLPLVLVEPVASTEASEEETGAEAGLVAIGAQDAWEMGLTGAGRLVCSFDTGVYGSHSALASSWRGANGGTVAESWFDPYSDTDFPCDSRGHGTHTMGTMVGVDGADTVGVAFGAEWIAAAVVDRGGNIDRTVSDILSAFEWAADPDGDSSTTNDIPDVVNNSWGVPSGYYGPCDMTFWDAIDNLEALGVVCIFAAGNEGPTAQTCRTPADRITTQFNAFAVGAINSSTMTIGSFSSRGPSGCDGQTIKPEITAPGVTIRSCSNSGGYTNKTGTSMAAPHVSGAVAILRQFNPEATVDEIKAALIASATDLGDAGEDNSYGYGLLNIKKALYNMPTPSNPFIHIISAEVNNGSDAVEPGDQFGLELTLENMGADEYIDVAVNSTSSDVIIINGESDLGYFGTFDTTTVSVFDIKIPNNYNGEDEFTVTLTFSSGDWSQEYDFVIAVNTEIVGSIATITTDNVTMSFSNYGQFGLGENSLNPQGGVGFKYPVDGVDFMKEAALLISANGVVSDGVRNSENEPDNDFLALADGDAYVTNPGVYSDYDGYAEYSDSTAEEPIGLNITQRCYAWESDTKFIIVEFTIENTSSESIDDLMVGMFCDWDMNLSSGIDDIVDYYDSQSLGYIQDSPSGWCVGVRSLTDYPASYRAINCDEDLADGFSDSMKIQYMNDGLNVTSYSTPGDYAHLLSVGPYQLASGELEVVAFAFIAGESLEDLADQAALAFDMYPQLTPIDDDESELPKTAELFQNYPNPFNNQTVISLNVNAPTQLAIYDINGRLVNKLDIESAGYNEIIWNGKNLSGKDVVSGVYFYNLTGNQGLISKKMLFLK